jgi:hypothetical protein
VDPDDRAAQPRPPRDETPEQAGEQTPPAERYADAPRAPRVDDIRQFRGSFIGMVGLACVPFLVWGAHDAYGTGWTIGLTFWWVFLLTLGIAWFTPYPRRMVWLPVVGLATWLAVVLLARS